MSAKKFNRILLGILIMLVLATAGGLAFSNFFMKKSADKLVNTKLDNIAYDNQEQSYLQARKDLEKYADLNETLQMILPKTKDQAQAVSELYRIGDETNIKVESITFPSSSLGQKSSAASTNNTSSSSNSSTSTTSSTNSVTQAKTVDGMPGVLGIDISLKLAPTSGDSIDYDDMINFLQKVESNRRSMRIKQITVNTDIENGGVTFELVLTIFVKP